VLLVSPAFLASDFIANDELPPILESAEHGGTVILSVLVKPSRYVQTKSISQFQAINNPSRTLVEMNEGEIDRVWVRLTEAIEVALAVEPMPMPNPGEKDEPSGEDAPPGKDSTRTPGVPPVRPTEVRGAGMEVNLLEEVEIKNTRAGNVTGVASDHASIGSNPEAKVNVLNKSKIEGSELGDISGVTLKGGEKKSE
jgi:hypothetical protein